MREMTEEHLARWLVDYIWFSRENSVGGIYYMRFHLPQLPTRLLYDRETGEMATQVSRYGSSLELLLHNNAKSFTYMVTPHIDEHTD